ncbi:hypothetical protein BH11ARM2_BH11ARM2_23800 [soil metagenome]
MIVPPFIAELPRLPKPYAMRDWRAVAQGYTRLALSEKGGAEYLPLMWHDGDALGLPSYVGHPEMKGGADHEAITVLGTLLGGSLVGADVARYVPGAANYFSPEDGVTLNRTRTRSGVTFWYEIFPSILLAQLADKTPGWKEGKDLAKRQAERWGGAIRAMGLDFNHTAFDLRKMAPFDNGVWREPDAAAGLAYLELGAGRIGDARSALDALQKMTANPLYEVLMSYGALAAARMNAEHGTAYDVPRFVDWCLEPGPTRPGWGMVRGRWGGYDAGGLIGSTLDWGGYAFAMDTFVLGGNLAPLARYDDRFSAAVGRWFLNAANASRLFYGVDLPEDHRSTPDWKGDPDAVIPYEGLKKEWKGLSPVATGDPTAFGWAKTDRCLYGAGFAGLFGAIVHTTDVPRILRLDLRAADFFAPNAYPTDLLWNPYKESKTVILDLGVRPVRLWDAVGNRELAAKAHGKYRLSLKGDQAVQLVQIPLGAKLLRKEGRLVADGKTVDFRL